MPTKTQNTHFSERLYYVDSLSSFVGGTACYNGNIAVSQMLWGDTTCTFAYTYDSMNRLVESRVLKYKSIVYTVPATAVTASYDMEHAAFDPDSMEYHITEYNGNIESCYTPRDTTLRIFNTIGYWADSTYFYTVKDHLGNICAVVNATTDTVVQRTMYYASGVPMAQSWGRDTQPYLYNGKEFIEAHGWNTFDYGFRGYYAPIGRFTSIDPLAEQTPWQSPYAYAGNNFINNIDWMGLSTYGGMTSFGHAADICQYIVIDGQGNYLGGVNNDDDGIYIDPTGKWKPGDKIDGLDKVGRMMLAFWMYDNWIGKGNKAPGFYYKNNYSISISGSIGWQISADKFVGLSLPSWELFNLSISLGSYSEGFEWGQFEVDYIGNDKEFKTTMGAQFILGYEYSIKHNVWTDLPNWESLTNTFWGGPVYVDSNGTFGLTLSFALIGGISVTISGNFYYEDNK